MKISSRLLLSCGFALLTAALAGQARAAQEIEATYSESTTGFEYELFPGWATCQGVSIPWNCTNANDKVGYNVWASWSEGYAAEFRVNGEQVSAGDTAWAQIALYCDDGSFGDNFVTGSGTNGPDYVESVCYTASGDYGTANQVSFAYGVEAIGAS